MPTKLDNEDRIALVSKVAGGKQEKKEKVQRREKPIQRKVSIKP